MKNIFIGIAVATIFIIGASAVAPSASALTVDEIQAQIKVLLAKVAELRLQLNTVETVETQPSDSDSVATPNKHRICSILARNLAQGTRGDDVRGLQEFLSEEGYLSANATGYFGPATAQAVAKWQASQGVSSVGSVGPMTRERIKIWCGGGGNNERFSATPQRGVAPLSVTFYTNISGFRPTSDQYTIDFGDGSSERAADCYAPADACQRPGENKHTYASDGTYTATLVHTSDPCGGNPLCMAPTSREVVGKAQIYVGASVGCTKEYVPVCGMKPIVCITTPCNPIPQTYGNRCMMNADGANFAYAGACRSDAGNKPPVISSFSGPTTLAQNVSGTWTIRASDPENGNLTYHITWGDEGRAIPASSLAARESFVQTTTFTHTYSTAGTYTVTIVVSDSSGAQAKTSSTVRVGREATACTFEYAPVCGQPPMPTCPSGMACIQVMPQPQTYGNRCMMNAAGATFVYSGECRAY